MTWRQQYVAAYERWQNRKYPATVAAYGCLLPNWPKVSTSNGLTQLIIKFLEYEGWRATRVNTQGQYVEQKYKGRVISKGWRPSQTRRGSADISATICGRSVMLEVKTGRDRPSGYQLAEQVRERAAGGIYEFISEPQEFFNWYNNFIINFTEPPHQI